METHGNLHLLKNESAHLCRFKSIEGSATEVFEMSQMNATRDFSNSSDMPAETIGKTNETEFDIDICKRSNLQDNNII